MNSLVKIRKFCRLCEHHEMETALPMGKSPIAEKYESSQAKSKEHEMVPLDLYYCRKCHHVQLLHVVDPHYLWADFTFKTGSKSVLVEHMMQEAKKIIAFSEIKPHELILDIGSNDGTFLKCFRNYGHKNLLGVEPVAEIAQDAIRGGIETAIGFMDLDRAAELLDRGQRAKLITAFNVYAHSDDLVIMTKSIKKVLSPDGLFVFEVSYLLDVVENSLIGTIFHEHLSYHSVTSLSLFLESQGLTFIRVERAEEQGGSLIGYAQRQDGPLKTDQSVALFLENERAQKLNSIQPYLNLRKKLGFLSQEIAALLDQIKRRGKVICAFGAARSGTTLISYYNLSEYLTCIFDDNVEKQGKFSPGHGMEVLGTSKIIQIKPDFMILLAWMHSEQIIANHQGFLERGGKFIEIHPQLKVVDLNSTQIEE